MLFPRVRLVFCYYKNTMLVPTRDQQSPIWRRSKAIAVIPARGGSKRLSRKNIYPLLGRPMIFYAIEACKKSKHIKRVFVSTEDEEIKKVSKRLGAEIIDRPEYLSEDHIWTQDVLKHAAQAIMERGIKYDILVRIQANSPMVEPEKIDEAIEKLRKNNLWEVFSVDKDGIEDAAIHVLRRNVAFQNSFSVYKAVISTDYMDVHTKEDIEKVEEIFGERLKKIK